MLQQGLIRESASPWGFPVLFVKKPGGKWRMCVDFRALNAVTRKNGTPLPRISECLTLIGNAPFLSKIDLTQGYYQIRVAGGDREKTAFNTREGKFEYIGMPFGLTNAPATFQTLMNRILRPFLGKFVIVYLDDIVIYSASLGEHYEHLRAVLQALKDNTLFAKPSKCVIAANELEFCGFVVGSGFRRPIASKIQVILDWPRPTNVHEVRQFLGIAQYYREAFPQFTKAALPLFELLKEADAEQRKKKYRKVTWNAQAERAFTQIKEIAGAETILAQADTTRGDFEIDADASEWAIGCRLSQWNTAHTKLFPVAYDGRKLSPAEINYPIHEKELLAVKYALQVWRIYIDNGFTVIVWTDHESLKYLSTMKNPSKRLARWIDEFGEYSLDIRYKKGGENTIPDAISRRPDWMGEGPRNRAAVVAAVRTMDMDEDEWASHMVALIEKGTEPPETWKAAIYERRGEFTTDNDGQLVHHDELGPSPYLPHIFRADFLERMHKEFGHLGYPGLLGVVTGRGWWQNLEKDIRNFARICPQCQCSQRPRPTQERELPQITSSLTLELFDRWAIDLIGILPQTPAGNRWIFSGIEYLTGWPVAIALRDAKAETVARALHENITIPYGPFKELLSDNGPQFVGQLMRAYLKRVQAKYRVTTPYHPRTNGKVENFNGILGTLLTKMLVNKPTILWDQYLPQALFATRIRIHSGTQRSPYYLLYGRNPRLPSDHNEIRPLATGVADWERGLERIEQMQHARMVANERLIQKAIKAQKIRADTVKHSPFVVNEWVLVRAEARAKFEAKWYGPYKVIKVMPLGTYSLEDPEGRVVKTLINGQRLVPAYCGEKTIRTLWNSSRIQGALRRRNIELIKPSEEVAELFEQESKDTLSYDELTTISKKEWETLEAERAARKEKEAHLNPTAKDYNDLREGIREGLKEVRDSLPPSELPLQIHQDTPGDAQDRRVEKEFDPLQQATTHDDNNEENIEPEETGDEDVQMDTVNDNDLVETTHEETRMEVDTNEDQQLPTPTTELTQRMPIWQRELQASLGERVRGDSHPRPGLRERPARRILT